MNSVMCYAKDIIMSKKIILRAQNCDIYCCRDVKINIYFFIYVQSHNVHINYTNI